MLDQVGSSQDPSSTLTDIPEGEYLSDAMHSRPYEAVDPLNADLAGKRVLVVGSGAVGQAVAYHMPRLVPLTSLSVVMAT